MAIQAGAGLAGYQQFGDVPAKDLISPEQALDNVLSNFFAGTWPRTCAFHLGGGRLRFTDCPL
jgi:hypothetical protein